MIRTTKFFVAVFLWGSLLPQLTAQDKETGAPKTLHWHDSLDDALKESEASGRPILMEIHGRPWCPPCVAQGQKVIDQPEFSDWVRDRFVLLEVEVGEGYDRRKGNAIWAEQFRRHQLSGIPAAVLLKPDGESIGIVYPKDNVSQWIGAASNLLTADAVRKPPTIPFRLTPSNNLSVPATIDDRIAVNLMFHTAADSVSITTATADEYPEIKFSEEVDSESWGGSSKMGIGEASVSIGPLPATSVTIFESRQSGHGTQGKFGPDQLPSKIFAVDFEKSEIRCLSAVPSGVTNAESGWNQLPLDRDSGMMLIEANVETSDQSASAKFLIHSGYSGIGLFSRSFVEANNWVAELPAEKESEVSDSAGNVLITKRLRIPRLSVGSVELTDVPVSAFEGALAGQQFNVLGADFLKRFQWVFDLQNDRVYFKQNSLAAEPFFDG